MFGLGEASARETKVSNYVDHLNLLLADIRQAPLATQFPASVNAAEQQFIQFGDKAIEYSPFDQMTEVEFAEFIKYGDDVNQAMNEILANLTPGEAQPPLLATKKLDVGKLVAGLAVVAGIGALVYFAGRKRMPLGALPPSRRDEPIGEETWENRFGFGPREVEGVDMFRNKRSYMYTPHTNYVGPIPPETGGAHTWRTKDNSEVVARLLKTKEWRGSTAVDMGDVIEVRHPGGAVARIIKQRPAKKKGRR